METILDRLIPIEGSNAEPCDICGCPGRWIDVYNNPYCEICLPCHRRTLLARREIIVGTSWQDRRSLVVDGDDSDDQAEADHGPFAGYDPFGSDAPPKGIWHPLADRDQRKILAPPQSGQTS